MAENKEARKAGRVGASTSPVRRFMIVALILMAGIGALSIRGSIPWPLALLIALNGATIMLYGYDKAVAGGAKTRVPEAVLHVLALIGGSPGPSWASECSATRSPRVRFSGSSG